MPNDCWYCGEPVIYPDLREFRALVVVTTDRKYNGDETVIYSYFHRRCREIHKEIGRIPQEE